VLAQGLATNCAMAEATVWRGTSSQAKNAGAFVLCGLCLCVLFLLFAVLWRNESAIDLSPYILSPAIVPIFIALSRFLQTKNKIYELTTERLKITEGIFNKITETLELYRVKDLETRQPFWERAFGIENVQISTADVSTPFVLIEAVLKKIGLGDKIRNAVENVRMQKRVRELDIECAGVRR
jgi:uncharacterized membrane protein YdbT with pleckstrin-like domain